MTPEFAIWLWLSIAMPSRPCAEKPHIKIEYSECDWKSQNQYTDDEGYERNKMLPYIGTNCAVFHGPFEVKVNNCKAKIPPKYWEKGRDISILGLWAHCSE